MTYRDNLTMKVAGTDRLYMLTIAVLYNRAASSHAFRLQVLRAWSDSLFRAFIKSTHTAYSTQQ